MKVLVTGAAGRAGSAVTARLLERGHQVRATDQRSRHGLASPIVIDNLLMPEAAYRLIDGVDVVVHLANHPNIAMGTPQRVFSENCAMNVNVFQAASDLKTPRVIFASSIQTVIGKTERRREDPEPCRLPYLPMDSAMPANPGNAYASSKVASETLLQQLCQFEGLAAVALRLPMLISDEGLEERHRRWIGRRSDRAPGGQSEAFTFLRLGDLADLIARLIDAPWSGYRNYLPADARNFIGVEAREAYENWLSHVPLRVPIDQLTTLVDCSSIEREMGWVQPGRGQTTLQAHAA